nr:MAG TPA: hypothetical protein [Caudoviricetes sp.]DAS11433.1 MAG TPA: hypothetical protein [Caudoviricetes sp.]
MASLKCKRILAKFQKIYLIFSGILQRLNKH